ncbi:MAG: putative AsnC family transcriptional regulator [Ilumatobacteraceae bacterium]|nr:putative AsnC family transcriptional regulator [Ilumatobacteraceae bacterium]
MDDIDRAIIDQLQRNARLTNSELADRVGLTPSPCLRRVKQLEQQGVIRGYTALVDPASIGRSYEPLVWVTLSKVTRESLSEFEQAVERLGDVVEVMRMMGQPDYLLRIETTDAASFESLYMDHLASLPHVQTLTSQLAMKTVKRAHAAPMRARR